MKNIAIGICIISRNGLLGCRVSVLQLSYTLPALSKVVVWMYIPTGSANSLSFCPWWQLVISISLSFFCFLPGREGFEHLVINFKQGECCESLCCTTVTYIILYINDNSIKTILNKESSCRVIDTFSRHQCLSRNEWHCFVFIVFVFFNLHTAEWTGFWCPYLWVLRHVQFHITTTRNWDTEQFHLLKQVPHTTRCLPPTPNPIDLFLTITVSPVPECHINGIIQYVTFWGWHWVYSFEIWPCCCIYQSFIYFVHLSWMLGSIAVY